MESLSQDKLSKLMREVTHTLSPEVMDFVRIKVSKLAPWFGGGNFMIRVVMDTNTLFQCVRGRMLDGSCFLDKIGNSPALELCAPPALEREIMEKIEIKFPKEKKTRELDIDKSKDVARELLALITIRDDIDHSARQRAHEMLGMRDVDDIPFLGLYFSSSAHGIVTNDKDLRDQDGVQTFQLGEVGSILTSVNCGTLAIFITHHSLPGVLRIIYEIGCAVLCGFVSMLLKAGKAISTGLQMGFDYVKDRHPLVQILAAIGLGVVEYKTGFFRKSAVAIYKLVAQVVRVLKDFLTALAGLVGASFILLGELMKFADEAMIQIHELEEAAKVAELPA